MQCRFPRWRAVLAATAVTAVMPAAAGAATQAQIDAAVAGGAAFLRAQQLADGSLDGFNGNWAVTSLAAAGVNAADVESGPATQSLQDWVWGYDTTAPGGWPDYTTIPNPSGGGELGKAILITRSAGIDPARVSPAVNLVAALASGYDAATGSFGNSAANSDGFAALALADLPGIPPALLRRVVQGTRALQYADGGWTWTNTPGATTDDVDMTGAALAILCRAGGADQSDPQVQAGLAWLKARQDEATGAFEVRSGFLPRLNTPSNGWALAGLNACGVDAQGAAWSTSGGNVVDWLLGMQRADGSFKYVPEDDETPNPSYDTNATEASIRPLAGALFSAAPPAREDPADPVWRPVTPPATGTPVPVAVAIDDGTPDPRFCAVTIPDGTPLTAVLEAARDTSAPAGCVDEIATAGGTVSSLNGLGASGTWRARVDGESVGAPGAQPIGFGDTVWLSYEAAAEPPSPGGGGGQPAPAPPAAAPATPDPAATEAAPAPEPTPTTPSAPSATPPAGSGAAPVARIARVRRLVMDRRGRVTLRVRCPEPAAGAGSCTSRLRIAMRVRGKRVQVTRALSVRPGATERVRVRLSARQRQNLRRHGSARIRIVQLVDGERRGTAMTVRVRVR